MPIQLQPQSASLDAWAALAGEEGFSFEILDVFSFPAVGNPQQAASLMELYRKTNLTQSVHGAFIDVNPASGDAAFRKLSRKRCRESCEGAVKLGARNVVLHSSAFPFLRGPYLDGWAAHCAVFYEELTEQYPVNLYIENAQDVDPTPLRLLMDTTPSDRIGVCLDVGHANYSRVPVEQWFEILGDRIGYLHLSDNLGQFDDHLPLGQGNIDWQQVNHCWEKLKKPVTITLETGSLESTMQSIGFLREHGYFGLKGQSNG